MERPVVTVLDPSGPRRPPDLLEVRPRRTPRPAPAGIGLLAAAVLVAGTVAAVDQRADRRAAARAQAAAYGASLEVPTGGYSAQYVVAPDDPVARLLVRVRVRNSGPLPLVVERATLGGLLSRAEAEVRPAGRRRSSCPARCAAPLSGRSAPGRTT